jgi:hypothetical protein
MSQNSFIAKTLRFIGILLMALTGGFTLLGGIGTSCAALNPTGFGSMAALAPFQWLYILFVLTGIAIGVWGIRATVKLVKGAPDSYKMSLQALIAGVVIGFIHIYASRAARQIHACGRGGVHHGPYADRSSCSSAFRASGRASTSTKATREQPALQAARRRSCSAR